jgi:hypothetical protein
MVSANCRQKGFLRHKNRASEISETLVISNGGPLGTRTLGPLIKSQLLYQLS